MLQEYKLQKQLWNTSSKQYALHADLMFYAKSKSKEVDDRIGQ